MNIAFFDLLALAENYLTAFSHCPSTEGCKKLAADFNVALAEYRLIAEREASPKESLASILSEYIVAVSDRVARAPQQQPSPREAELFHKLNSLL